MTEATTRDDPEVSADLSESFDVYSLSMPSAKMYVLPRSAAHLVIGLQKAILHLSEEHKNATRLAHQKLSCAILVAEAPAAAAVVALLPSACLAN